VNHPHAILDKVDELFIGRVNTALRKPETVHCALQCRTSLKDAYRSGEARGGNAFIYGRGYSVFLGFLVLRGNHEGFGDLLIKPAVRSVGVDLEQDSAVKSLRA